MTDIPLPNPFVNYTDEQLFDSQLMLELVCGRNKSTTRNKHRTHACALADILAIEAQNRGKPSPQPPFKA